MIKNIKAHKNENFLKNRLSAALLALLGFIVGIYGIGIITLLLGGRIGTASGTAGFVSGALFALALVPRNLQTKSLAFLGGSFFLFSLCASWFFDYSSDGIGYHKPAVIQLLDGWNPYRDLPWSGEVVYWTSIYPKASWILAAQTVAISGCIEQGKVFNLLAMGAAFLSAWRFLGRKMTFNPQSALVASILIGFNPISVYQAFTFYLDGLLTSFFTILLFSLAEVLDQPKKKVLWFEATAGAVLLANLKFTGLVYAAVVLFLFVAATIRRWGNRHFINSALAAGLILVMAIGIFGKSPYLDNLTHARPLFFPVMGGWTEDFLEKYRPRNFTGMDRFSRWVVSNLSHSHSVYPPDVAKMRWPFDLSKVGRHWVDTNVGGFGPLFGESLLLSSIILVFAFRSLTLPSLASLFVLGSVLITTFIHKESWWARYAPQMFLIPVLAACYLQKSNKSWIRNGGVVVLILLLLNLLVVGALSTGTKAWGNILWRQDIAQIKEKSTGATVEVDFGDCGALKRQLREMGLQFTESKKDGSADWKPMPIFKKCFWRLQEGGSE